MDPDTMAVLGRYDPTVLAMTDLLRHQVDFTQHFIEGQRQLAQGAGAEPSHSGYQYTTLEATKAFIAVHSKPVMSLEEALAQVAREDDGEYFWQDDSAYA
jgi:hypothetical protein